MTIIDAHADAAHTLAESREPTAQFFKFSHLPEKLQEISAPFTLLAAMICTLPRNPERSVALRKLLEAKDAAVRAALFVDSK